MNPALALQLGLPPEWFDFDPECAQDLCDEGFGSSRPMSREQFWFFYPLRVRYSEVDCQGVVFNANYLMYFDTTITEYFRALGYDQPADAKTTGVDLPRRQIAY